MASSAQDATQFRFKELEKTDSLFLDRFEEGPGIFQQTLLATNSSIQVALQKWRNSVSLEEPSPIKTAKQIFISIGFGLNTLFGLIESAAKIALFIIPFLIALTIRWATDAQEDSLVDNIGYITGALSLIAAFYTLQSAISTVTNLQTPDQPISYNGQMAWFDFL